MNLPDALSTLQGWLPPNPADDTPQQAAARVVVEAFANRLKAAEDVCLLYGWTAARGDSDPDKACHQLWDFWTKLVGTNYLSPRAHPDLHDSIPTLAKERDAIRERTLAAIKASDTPEAAG